MTVSYFLQVYSVVLEMYFNDCSLSLHYPSPYAHMYTLGRPIYTCGLSHALYCAYIRNIIFFILFYFCDKKKSSAVIFTFLVIDVVIYLHAAYFRFQFINLLNLMMFVHLCSCYY